jgi:O-antigen ligase
MTADTIFKFVEAGHFVTYGLAVFLFSLRRPDSRLLRGLLAVLAAWIAGVVYTIYVYNPAGAAAGHDDGLHFPEGNYDNNTVAVTLMAGWIGPVILLSIVAACQSMRDRVGHRRTERASDSSLERPRDE